MRPAPMIERMYCNRDSSVLLMLTTGLRPSGTMGTREGNGSLAVYDAGYIRSFGCR